ncbi:hypothetical protein A3D72_04725 [Candidatus Uhrbacteria bacterium RIFCSPHIGHO2_02_FULL_57_19]|uniref:Thymidylate synthase, flavin-dependent n=1 Tax=Candidatus Uhrbacteria bacterium RIFCSPHIGHO2_02_FULL_57_19 TaxID=1802391 RepID=A0A1F7U7Q3_9BACT|nr:MAG: hypothetical protein A3D72_04725 [Candidatus Uhrbacteria bacterium RIFCSPHIGHO2_02_FULL_57_19]
METSGDQKAAETPETSDLGNERQIYTLREDEHLTPEVIAVAFAKCSRSPASFRANAAEITAEKSAEFHEKWVVGYGHGSVAEHATLHVAFENVSNVATKVIEDCRLASYTEKSTRYQVYDRNRYYKPRAIMESNHADRYVETMDSLFDIYLALAPIMMEFMRKKHPKPEEMKDRLYEGVTKARACDAIRYLLPAATLTNLGMTANARVFEWAITKFYSHPLEEMREIADELKRVTLGVTPTLVKYASPIPYLQETAPALAALEREFTADFREIDPTEAVRIVEFDPQAEIKIITSLLYRAGHYSYDQIRERVEIMSREEKERVIDEALSRRGPHDQTLREFEHAYYTFDILMDYGAFRDVQRHRMATQTNQEITALHGYDVPPEIIEAGKEEVFRGAMERAGELYHAIYADLPREAQYCVPMAFRKRVLITWNLRELHNFIPLRSGKKGHPSYRKIAQLCWEKLNEVHPLLARYVRVDMSDETISTVGNKPQAIGSL